MIEIDHALKKVLGESNPLKPIILSLENVSGFFLAEDIESNADVPRFDKATMDGYAIRSEDSAHDAILNVIGTVAAGEFFTKPVSKDCAVKIMTGAPIPEGSDTVIPIEWTSEPSPRLVKLDSPIDPGKNIAFQGEEIKKDALILKRGTRIDPVATAILAQIGHTNVLVYPRPKLSILSTGTELVEPDIVPKSGQIRDSNSFCVLNQCREWNADGTRRLIVADDVDKLQSAIRNAIDERPDIIIITGGVSVGEFDLVPDALKKIGVDIIFHNIAQKPGKPMLFGKLGEILIFGLPGNPVATYLDFELYVGPAICRLMGDEQFEIDYLTAIAEEDFKIKSDRTYFHPALVKQMESNWVAYPVSTHGSGDIYSIVKANAFARFDPGTYIVPAGEEIEFFIPRGRAIGT